MLLVEKFQYIKLVREDGGEDGRKYVTPNNDKLPSVTTILDRTKSEESKKALEGWRKSIGHKKATNITEEAAFRGTLMHGYLEKYLKGEEVKAGTNFFHKQAFNMANIVLNNFLKPNVQEVWGLETNLYYPDAYAGTTDLIGVYQGIPSIIDFKQSNKLKTDERVEDYKNQLVAYADAHNEIYGTNIKQGVIMMCTKDLEPQCWVLKGDEFDEYRNKWWARVSQYYQV